MEAFSALLAPSARNSPVTSEFPSQRDSYHDDVIKWKHFQRYWPFVWGIHRGLTKASDAELLYFLSLSSVIVSCRFETLWETQYGCHSTSDIFKWIFMDGKCCTWVPISPRVLLNGPTNNRAALIMASDNGLAPNRGHAFTWTYDGTVCWHIYASLSPDGLNN